MVTTSFTGSWPQRVGAIGPSPFAMSLESTIFPILWAVTEIPPPMWQMIRFMSSYFLPCFAAKRMPISFWFNAWIRLSLYTPFSRLHGLHPGTHLHLVDLLQMQLRRILWKMHLPAVRLRLPDALRYSRFLHAQEVCHQ